MYSSERHRRAPRRSSRRAVLPRGRGHEGGGRPTGLDGEPVGVGANMVV